MFDLLLESSHRDDSNKRSNIGFGQEIMELASIEVYFTHVIWSSVYKSMLNYIYRCTNLCAIVSISVQIHAKLSTSVEDPIAGQDLQLWHRQTNASVLLMQQQPPL